MWAYPGSSYSNHPSPEELSVVKVETQVHKVLDSALLRHLVLALTPCEEGLPALGSVPQVPFLPLLQFFLFTALVILCKVSGMTEATHGALVSPWMPPGQATSHASNGTAQSCEERERERSTRSRSVGEEMEDEDPY
jgi:hypothetical protein